MNNTQYIETMISSNERIYIDTATLMQEGMVRFVANNKDFLSGTKHKLIITQNVRSELARHLDSEIEEKQEKALTAIGLISNHPEIFEVENMPLSKDEVARAFADAQLLSELTLHKSDFNQLLITNDRKLSRDAYRLNQQESCRGHQIKVCYINAWGDMNCCECVKEHIETKKTVSDMASVPHESLKNMPVAKAESPANTSEWHFDWQSAGMGMVVCGLLGLGIKHCEKFLKYAG